MIEINFLDKQPKKHLALLLFAIMFALLLASITGLIFYQKSNYANHIESKQNKIEEIEASLLELQKGAANEQKLLQIQKDIVSLKSEMQPNAALYKQLLGLLPTPDQLRGYHQNMDENQLVVNVELKTLEDVALYIGKVAEQEFITDTQLTNVISIDSGYEATITLTVDNEILLEELGAND